MKILFINPADYLEIGIPQGIAVLSALLKQDNHIVKLFDTAFLKPQTYIDQHSGAGDTIYKSTPYTLEDLVKDDSSVVIVEELQKMINDFQPDLIAVSTMTSNYDFAIELLKNIRMKCSVIFGGVHTTIKPEEVISNDLVDIICIGEGEKAVIELCRAMESGKEISTIKNLWVKQEDGTIVKNDLGEFIDLDTLPCPDWSLFDSRHLYRPFMGKVYTGGFYISSRGCPCQCTYCVNRTLQGLFRGCGNYFRTQKPETTARHLTELKEKYGSTWFKFGDDTFLLQKESALEELSQMIKPLKIQFGCSIRPNTVTEEKVKIVREMGCVAMSIGIETGNENLRRNVLNRQISNVEIEKAFKIVNNHGIRISSFNLVGIPGETRENVFETIELNRKLNVKAANVYVLYPFPGSQIEIDYNTNYRNSNGDLIPMNKAAIFDLSIMSPDEVEGLAKTFNLYISLPKQLWPVIKYAEGTSNQSNELYQALSDYSASLIDEQ